MSAEWNNACEAVALKLDALQRGMASMKDMPHRAHLHKDYELMASTFRIAAETARECKKE